MQTKTDYTITPSPQPQAAGGGEAKPFVMPADDELDAALDAPVAQFKNPSEPEQPVKTGVSGLMLPPAALSDQGKSPSEINWETLETAGADKEVPLVQIGGIDIVGQRFSYKEARELLAELKDAGYCHSIGVIDRKVGKHVTMTWSVTIGLVQVTPHQANEIALSLAEELE